MTEADKVLPGGIETEPNGTENPPESVIIAEQARQMQARAMAESDPKLRRHAALLFERARRSRIREELGAEEKNNDQPSTTRTNT